MARNIEIKARIASVAALAPAAAALADSGPIDIVQDDTFFRCNAGRLKLRVFGCGDGSGAGCSGVDGGGGGGDGRGAIVDGAGGELIFYRREDLKGPKESFYVRSPVLEPGSLREALSLAYGVSGRVRKHRILYLVGRTRVHLDCVEGLGEFLELEVVLREDETPADGRREAEQLMSRLGIGADQLLDRAYVDLIAHDGPAQYGPAQNGSAGGGNRGTLGA